MSILCALRVSQSFWVMSIGADHHPNKLWNEWMANERVTITTMQSKTDYSNHQRNKMHDFEPVWTANVSLVIDHRCKCNRMAFVGLSFSASWLHTVNWEWVCWWWVVVFGRDLHSEKIEIFIAYLISLHTKSNSSAHLRPRCRCKEEGKTNVHLHTNTKSARMCRISFSIWSLWRCVIKSCLLCLNLRDHNSCLQSVMRMYALAKRAPRWHEAMNISLLLTKY